MAYNALCWFFVIQSVDVLRFPEQNKIELKIFSEFHHLVKAD